MKQEAMAFSDRKQGIQKARVKEDMEEVRKQIHSLPNPEGGSPTAEVSSS